MAGSWKALVHPAQNQRSGAGRLLHRGKHGLTELQIDAIYHFPGICKPVAAWEDEIREKSNQICSL